MVEELDTNRTGYSSETRPEASLHPPRPAAPQRPQPGHPLPCSTLGASCFPSALQTPRPHSATPQPPSAPPTHTHQEARGAVQQAAHAADEAARQEGRVLGGRARAVLLGPEEPPQRGVLCCPRRRHRAAGRERPR